MLPGQRAFRTCYDRRRSESASRHVPSVYTELAGADNDRKIDSKLLYTEEKRICSLAVSDHPNYMFHLYVCILK